MILEHLIFESRNFKTYAKTDTAKPGPGGAEEESMILK